jgi:hypothetical protein
VSAGSQHQGPTTFDPTADADFRSDEIGQCPRASAAEYPRSERPNVIGELSLAAAIVPGLAFVMPSLTAARGDKAARV